MIKARVDKASSEPTTSLRRIVGVSVIIEIGTGIALIAAPGLVVTLLAGHSVPEGWLALPRCYGITLLALGIACAPSQGATAIAALRALLTYNALVALYLTVLATTGQWNGVMLWPGIGLHALFALGLAVQKGRQAHV